MAYLDDNTSLIRMKRDFDQFVHDGNDSRGVSAFSLDDIRDLSYKNISNDNGAISVQALLEKEKQSKLKEGEIIAAKTQILKLQSKINTLETSNKRARYDFDKEIETVQSERSRESQKLSDLRSQLKFMTDKEAMSREGLQEYQREADRQRKKLEEQLVTLGKEKLQLADDLQQEKEQSWEKTAEHRRELMRIDTELKICKCELEETKAQLKLQLKRSSEITNQMKDCEEYRLKATQGEQKIKELELQLSRMEEDNVIAKTMKTQLTTFHDMERENRTLKDDNQYLRDIQDNNLLLKEQHASMKKKLERMDEKIAEYTRVTLENEELKARLQKWEQAERFGSKITSPSDLSKRLSELQNTEAIMLSKQGELQNSLLQKDSLEQRVHGDLHRVREELLREKTRADAAEALKTRMKRKLLLLQKERDGYKQIIDSYENEVTMNIGSQSQNHLQQLEENCHRYRNQFELLEIELSRVNEELLVTRQRMKELELQKSELKNVQPTKSQSDQQTIVQLREKIADLEKALETCEKDKYTLECRQEQRHLQGDYDPTKLKVLHFKMNPVDMASSHRKEEMRLLKEENERLTQRVRLLEENEGKMDDLTVAVEQKLKEPGSSKDIEEMRVHLATAELKNKRLMEAFKKTSQEVREVCYQLTGYKIDIPIHNQYRVTSMYADSPSDKLLFQQNEDGEIQMLGTDFSSTVSDLMETYLIQQDSIPAFLSAVTMELFSHRTMTMNYS